MSQQVFDQADRLEEQGKEEDALPIWQHLANTNPTRNVFLRLAGCARKLGLVDDAETAFHSALKIDGRSVRALAGLGSIAIERRDYSAAEEYLHRACALEKDPGTLTFLGVALRNRGKDGEAEQAYREAIALNSAYEEAYYNLGVLLRDSRPSEAEALFRTALGLDPHFGSAYRELGYLLSKREEARDSEAYLRRAIELDFRDSWAHIYLGSYLWQCNDFKAAESEFLAAAELQPDWAVPLWSLGNLYEFALNDYDTAQSWFQRALNVEPDDETAIRGLRRVQEKRSSTQ